MASIAHYQQYFEELSQAKEDASRLRDHFESFGSSLNRISGDGKDLKDLGVTVTPGDDCFEVSGPVQRLRFSLTLRQVPQTMRLLGQVTVHLLPQHDLFETPAVLGNFTFDPAAHSSLQWNQKVLKLNAWQEAHLIVIHFMATALSATLNQPEAQ